MKGRGILEICCLLLMALLVLTVQVHSQEGGSSIGGSCGPNEYCAVNKGLICHEATCQCGNGTLTEDLEYKMTWDEAAGECLALETSGCIGNEKNPVADERLKKVRCVDNLVCTQVENMPPGVGVCEEKKEDGGAGGGGDSGAMGFAATNTLIITLSIFVHFQ